MLNQVLVVFALLFGQHLQKFFHDQQEQPQHASAKTCSSSAASSCSSASSGFNQTGEDRTKTTTLGSTTAELCSWLSNDIVDLDFLSFSLFPQLCHATLFLLHSTHTHNLQQTLFLLHTHTLFLTYTLSKKMLLDAQGEWINSLVAKTLSHFEHQCTCLQSKG